MMRIYYLVAWMASLLSLCYGAQFVSGKDGQALVGSCIFQIPQFPVSQGSLQFWYSLQKPIDGIPSHTIVAASSGEKVCFSILLRQGKLQVQFKRAGQSADMTVALSGPQERRWHHFAMTWGQDQDYSRVKLYLDSMLVAQNTARLPEKLGAVDLRLNGNAIVAKADGGAPVAIDDFALYSYALPHRQIKASASTSANVRQVTNLPGCLLYAAFDGDLMTATGENLAENKHMHFLLRQLRPGKIDKYRDEIEFDYYFDVPMPEAKADNILNDGKDNSSVNWHNRNVSTICEFDRTYQLSMIEFAVRKHTKWYMLKELHISIDNGSGIFAAPYIIKTYGKPTTDKAPLIDDTCQLYFYTQKLAEPASRVKIKFVGTAAISVSEIRICAEPETEPAKNQEYFFLAR